MCELDWINGEFAKIAQTMKEATGMSSLSSAPTKLDLEQKPTNVWPMLAPVNDWSDKTHEVIIMRGPSGVGKSTWVKKFQEYLAGCGCSSHVFSADNYFMRSGSYKFDPALLPEAHNNCLRSFEDYVRTLEPYNQNVLIVDNTNMSGWEIAPYYRLAEAHGWDVRVVQVVAAAQPPELARRSVHGVPEAAIRRMLNAQQPLPDWWNLEYVFVV
jgi:hypothetical protein